MGSDDVRLQWRWYGAPGAVDRVARDEFCALPTHGRAALGVAIRRYCRGESPHGEVKHLHGTADLWEIRVQVGQDPFRAVFFKDSPVHRVGVVAIYKNQRKLPRSVLRKAEKRAATWRANSS